MGVQIVGVSFNDPDTLEYWAEDQGYQYELWKDKDKALAVHYGAAGSTGAIFPDRKSYLLNKKGELLLSYTDDVGVGTHPRQVLEDCKLLFGE